jgi:hypothetical protein
LVQSETFHGALVPFIGKTLASAQASFQEHNEALKKRVESHADPDTARTASSGTSWVRGRRPDQTDRNVVV